MLHKGEWVYALWDDYMTNLQSWMHREMICPDICEKFLSGLRTWRKGVNIVQEGNSVFQGVDEATQCHSRIGWSGYIEGCLKNHYTSAQTVYYKWIGS